MAHAHVPWLQELNITVLCLAITDVALMIDRARETSTKFRTVLTFFAKCHTAYSGQSYFTDDDLTTLGNKISTHMKCTYTYFVTQKHTLLNL